MRLTTLPILIALIVVASCGQHKQIATTKSTESLPGSLEKTSRAQCINLNSATAEELGRLPGVGEVIARRIVDYREHNGQFRRPEEVIIIEGFSDSKYRAIANLICVR